MSGYFEASLLSHTARGANGGCTAGERMAAAAEVERMPYLRAEFPGAEAVRLGEAPAVVQVEAVQAPAEMVALGGMIAQARIAAEALRV
jgi:hypothetical protein